MFNQETMTKKHLYTIIGGIVVVALAGAAYLYIKKDFSPDPVSDDSTINVGVDSPNEGVVIKPETNPENIISFDENQVTYPNLERTVTFPAGFPAEAEEIVKNNIRSLSKQLKEDPKSFQNWITLATQYKVVQDYNMVRDIFDFLNKAAPKNIVARVNLGNLYHYDLKQYDKAETVFKEALTIDNKDVDVYQGLFELYKYSYKTDTTLAEDTLKAGIANVPDNMDIRMTLAGYYTDLGRTADAKKTYEAILVKAQAAQNTNLITVVNAALAALNK